MTRIVFDRPGQRVRLGDIPAEPPRAITREKAAERLVSLGKEMFELQDSMFGSRACSVTSSPARAQT